MKKNESKKNMFYNLLDIVTDSVGNVINNISKLLADKKKSNLIKAIIRVVCALILIALLEIPFFLVGKIGEGIIYLCNMTFNSLITSVWYSFIEYSYLIFSLIIFSKLIVDMSFDKKYNFQIKKTKQSSKNIYSVIENITKALIGISLIPIVLLSVFLFALLGMEICLLVNGIWIISPILIVVGLLFIIIPLLSYIYDIVFLDKGGKK